MLLIRHIQLRMPRILVELEIDQRCSYLWQKRNYFPLSIKNNCLKISARLNCDLKNKHSCIVPQGVKIESREVFFHIKIAGCRTVVLRYTRGKLHCARFYVIFMIKNSWKYNDLSLTRTQGTEKLIWDKQKKIPLNSTGK